MTPFIFEAVDNDGQIFIIPDTLSKLSKQNLLVTFQNIGMSILLAILLPATLITARHIAIESMIPSSRHFLQKDADTLKSQGVTSEKKQMI